MSKPINDTAIGNLLNMLRRDGFQSYYAAFSALLEERNQLKDELERERMRLAACGVVAMSNTRETAKENREVSDEYKSSTFDEVCAAVDREMALRERVAELEAQNHALRRQHAEDEEECREANASLCREIEETIDLNRELTAAKKRIAELEPDFRVAALLLREEREELRTKLAAMQRQRDEATAWRPIEAAPMDGTVVLLFGDGRVTAGSWIREREVMASTYHHTTGVYLGSFPSGDIEPAYWQSHDGGFTEEHPPTHWMPLPQPPREKEGGGA